VRHLVPRLDPELQPLHPELGERPVAERSQRAGREPTPACLRRDDVGQLAGLGLTREQHDRAQITVVVGIGNREDEHPIGGQLGLEHAHLAGRVAAGMGVHPACARRMLDCGEVGFDVVQAVGTEHEAQASERRIGVVEHPLILGLR